MSSQTYVIDVYGAEGRASALAVLAVFRCIFGEFLPLAGQDLYENLGFGWDNSVLGFIGLAFLVFPFSFVRFSEALREKHPIEL